MSKRWIGVVVGKDLVNVVDAEVPDGNGPLVIVADITWRVQTGDRSAAYCVLHKQCADYVSENGIDQVVVKASAVSGQGGATLGVLQSAEARGVVLAAAAAKGTVRALSKAAISKTYGSRKVDEYVADDAFWQKHTSGNLRKMSREAAMLLIAARKA